MTNQEYKASLDELLQHASEALESEDKQAFVECLRSIRDISHTWESVGEQELLKKKREKQNTYPYGSQ